MERKSIVALRTHWRGELRLCGFDGWRVFVAVGEHGGLRSLDVCWGRHEVATEGWVR